MHPSCSQTGHRRTYGIRRTRMNTTTHPVAPEEVMAFLDGELSATDAQSVSTHIERCAECALLIGQFRSTSRSLSAWKVPAVSAKVGDSVADRTAKFRSGVKIGKANIFIRASFWTWKQWAASLGAAAATLVLVIAITTANLMRSPTQEKAISVVGHAGLQPMDQTFSTGSGFGNGQVNGGAGGIGGGAGPVREEQQKGPPGRI